MKIGVITLFPEMFTALTEHGVTGRGNKQGAFELSFYHPRDYTHDPHGRVDDRPYGGGPGMVMMVQPLRDAIKAAKADLPGAKVVYLSPKGQTFCHQAAVSMAKAGEIIFLAGRYEGIDQRVIDTYVDEIWSIGDYVLTGGELAAMVMIDAIIRWLPDVLGDDASAEQDSFVDGLLDHPHYTRPDTIDEQTVPAVLLGGHHREITRWRLKQALTATKQSRPDLWEGWERNNAQASELLEAARELLNEEPSDE